MAGILHYELLSRSRSRALERASWARSVSGLEFPRTRRHRLTTSSRIAKVPVWSSSFWRTPAHRQRILMVCRSSAPNTSATTAARSWRPRSRPRTFDISRGPRPRHAGTPRPRTRRQSRRRRTAPQRRSGTRGGSATTALASRRRRRACDGRQCKNHLNTKLAPHAVPRKSPPRAA